MTPQTKHFYAFGPFRLDSEKRVLVRDGTPVPLAPKAAETLLALVENAGRLVDKDDLMKRVWPDAFVEEVNLNKNIFFLRKVLGVWDGGREYIETVPKRGFRFVAPVNEVTHAEGGPQVQTSSGANLIGKRVSHYRVLEIVGGGGMGLVYKAEDLKLGRRVALKFLPEELATDSLTLQRFEREARTASSLNHPNICTIYEFGEHEGQPFLVMELLEGETLRELISKAQISVGGERSLLPLERLLDIAIQITEGLDAAHQKGIIHRDIKPANIFMTMQEQVKILDFGLAKMMQLGVGVENPHPANGRPDGAPAAVGAPDFSPANAGEEETGFQRRPGLKPNLDDASERRAGARLFHQPAAASLTLTGLAMGTAGYMSPEQVRGEKLDARTDLFSFGLVLYEMATGQRAFTGETAAILKDAILNRTPVPARDLNATLPPKLEEIINKALEKDRNARYQHASEISTDLNCLRQEAATRHRRWTIAVASGFAVAAIAGMLWFTKRQPTPLPELKLRQVTTNSSENPVRTGAISPDGKYLAYADRNGIRLKLIDTGDTQAIPQPEALKDGPVDWQIVQWFPDGTRFLANVAPPPERSSLGQHSSVWTVSMLGGVPQKLRDNAYVSPSSISPDGSLIAFGTNRGKYGDREIWVMGPNGEQARKIYESDENSSIQGPQWTSDGHRLGYLTIDNSEIAIETRDLKGGPAVRALSNVGDSLMDYFWLPDGRMIYVLIERGPNEYTCNFWQVRIDNDTGKVVEKPRRLTNWTGFCMDIGSITADGKRISFGEWAAQLSVYVAELGANGTRMGNARRLTLTKNKIYPSAWTADSKAVIFNSRSAGRWGIYKQFLDKDTAEPIVASLPGYSVYSELKDISLPRVSPDGAWILYMVSSKEPDFSAATKLMRVPVSGGPSELVMTANLYGPPSCANSPATVCVIAEQSKDLKQLIFSGLNPLNGRGREFTRFDIDPKDNYVWVLSPDGNRIVVLNTVEGPIHILSLAGQAPKQVEVKGWNSLDSVAWAADGTGLFVSSRVQQGSVLLHVNLRGNSQALWREEGSLGTYAIPSPDGRHLAIRSWTLESNIWTMENF